MGTSTDSCGRQESDPVIPWSCVNFCIINKLVQLLNPDSVMGNDWKGLASRLGYTTGNILTIDSGKNNNTEELFKDYNTRPNASFNDVYTCLQEMNRQDCLDVLKQHFDEIKQAYHEHRQQKPSLLHLSGGEMLSSSPRQYWSSHPSPSYVCGCVSHPVAGAVYSPHHFCSIPHGFGIGPHDPCSMPAHHHSLSPCTSIGQSTHPHKLHYECSSTPGYLPPHLRMNVQTDPSPMNSHGGNSNPPSQYMNGFNERVMPGPSSQPPLPMILQNPGLSHSLERPDQYKSYIDNMHLPHNINPQDNSNLGSMSSSDLSNNNNSWQSVDTNLSQSLVSILTNNSDTITRSGAASDCQNTDRIDSKDSLQKLVQISKVPEEYQPTEEYTRVVAEQKIEEKKKNNRVGKNYDEKQNLSGASGSSSGSSRSSGSKSESSYTYPLRAKIQTNDMTKDFASISIKKAPSVPQSYKPQAYQKVHGTRLFVTYSSDSQEHKKDIFCLCNFLKENNFKFYIDVKDRPQAQDGARQNEHLSRFDAADHILMCVSPKYLEDISGAEPPSSNGSNLHTHEIYQRMLQEYTDNLTRGKPSMPRAVILLFNSVTTNRLPEWMRKCSIYTWPSEYEDLFWMLMKPQNKIKAKCNGTNVEISGRQY